MRTRGLLKELLVISHSSGWWEREDNWSWMTKAERSFQVMKTGSLWSILAGFDVCPRLDYGWTKG